MRTSSPSALLLAALALPLAASASPRDRVDDGPEAVLEDLSRDVTTWLEMLNSDREVPERRYEWLEERLDALVDGLLVTRHRWDPGHEVLLDVAGFELSSMPQHSSFVGGSTKYRVREMGMEAIERLSAGPRREAFEDSLMRGVLPDPRRHPAHRRWVALFLVRRSSDEALDFALLSIVRDRDDPLRNDALALLPRRVDEEIDRFLVDNLGRLRTDPSEPHPFNLLRARLDRSPLVGSARVDLLNAVKSLLLSGDWRDASRGIELGRTLHPMRMAPMLVEALHHWFARETNVGGAKRVRWEIVRALQEISGRKIGDNVKNWETWLSAVRAGTVEVPTERALAGRVGSDSTPTFFGLEASSDRITFVIDRSQSMEAAWGEGTRSRYDEAIEQLMRFLQAAGPSTEFNIVLFSDEPVTSTPHLVEATPSNLERARGSLRRRKPDGSTNLRDAIEHALGLDEDGNPVPQRLRADTIVVLCDGETNTGSAWVRPLLERIDAELRVIFHCAQIGGRGDGTLETLARETSGEFVYVAGE